MFSLVRTCQVDLQSGLYTIYTPVSASSFALHSCQYLVVFMFLIAAILVDVKRESRRLSFTFSWRLTVFTKHIFMCLSEMCISSFVTWLFQSFADVYCVVFLLLILGGFHRLRYKVRYICMVCLFLLSILSLTGRNIFDFDFVKIKSNITASFFV